MDQSQISGKTKTLLVSILFGILAIVVLGLFSFFLFGSSSPVGLGWYVFSFAAGLTMIVLPCTLPLAFVIVPLSMGKGPMKGLAIALAFGLGITITLSMYGVVTALVGKTAITGLGASLETVKNYMYLVAGFFAYVF
ncbi:MAG: cytochrome C biogenesis protein, partial [Patescibacteria group bacterium]